MLLSFIAASIVSLAVVTIAVVPIEYEDYLTTEADEHIPTFFVVNGIKLGQVTGLGVDIEQRLHIFHRGNRVWDQSSFNSNEVFDKSKGAINVTTMLVVDTESGEILESRGSNQFYMPHGLTVDSEDNIWVTDVALHQVMKFSKSSNKASLILGEAFVPGNDGEHFCKPTDVAVATTGEFFVADGYCNSRIMKFDKDGSLIAKFGGPSDGYPAENGQFNVPHSITLIEDLDLICVADRENERIQCFSAGLRDGRDIPFGEFITKAEDLGRVFAIREKAHYLVGVTGNDFIGQTFPQVFIMDVNTGKTETYAKGLDNPHDLTVTNNGDVFIGEIGPNRVLKLSLGRSN